MNKSRRDEQYQISYVASRATGDLLQMWVCIQMWVCTFLEGLLIVRRIEVGYKFRIATGLFSPVKTK